MTESAEAVSAKAVDDQLIDELVHRAQAEGLQLTGEGGLLLQLTKRLLESALEGEITDHLGYDKHDAVGKNGGNSEPNPNIRRGRTVVYTLHAHLVFTPKYRRGPFTGEILTRCEEIMRAVCADFETELVEFNGERDHVHLLVHYPPKIAISRLVGSLKGVSARRLRQEFPGHIRKYLWGDHFWSPSYFAASCGGAPLAIIKEYIENQKRPG